MKKKTLKNNSVVRKYLLWLILLLLIVLQAVSFVYIVKIHDRIDEDSKNDLSTLINTEEERRYKYPPIDVAASRVYIPEARIYLPLNDTSRDIRYDYFGMKGHEAVFFSVSGIVGRQTDYDNPNCDKMVALTKTKGMESGGDFVLVGSIPPTKSGFQYIYKHASCQLYTDSLGRDLADAVKKLQQY
jgi:hypothetical protein